MERDDSWIAAGTGAAILLMIFGSITLVAAGGWDWFAKFLEGQAAAWVQGVGTIAAIFGGYYFVGHQIQAARSLELEKQVVDGLRRLESVGVLLTNAHSMLGAFQRDFQARSAPPYVSDHGEWERVRNGIGAIDVFAIPAPGVVLLLVQLPTQFTKAMGERDQAWRNYFEPRMGNIPTSRRGLGGDLDAMFNEVELTMNMLMLTIDACAEAAKEIRAKHPNHLWRSAASNSRASMHLE